MKLCKEHRACNCADCEACAQDCGVLSLKADAKLLFRIARTMETSTTAELLRAVEKTSESDRARMKEETAKRLKEIASYLQALAKKAETFDIHPTFDYTEMH